MTVNWNPGAFGTENKGWVCPKCGAVYAPWVATCQVCKPQKITYGNGTEIKPYSRPYSDSPDWQGNWETTR